MFAGHSGGCEGAVDDTPGGVADVAAGSGGVLGAVVVRVVLATVGVPRVVYWLMVVELVLVCG